MYCPFVCTALTRTPTEKIAQLNNLVVCDNSAHGVTRLRGRLQLSSLARSGSEMVERADEWRAAMIEKGWQ